MSIGSIFILCFIVGVLSKLAEIVADSKNPWCEFVAAVVLISGIIWLWLAQSLLAWVLAGLIVFGILCIWWFIGAVGAVVGLFSPSDRRD